MPVVLELQHSAEQSAFNLRRWEEVLADPYLTKLPHRIETDHYGNIVISPPPAMPHGVKQAEITRLLGALLPEGIVVSECPISTADGVKATDVAWLTGNRRAETTRVMSHSRARSLCRNNVAFEYQRRTPGKRCALL